MNQVFDTALLRNHRAQYGARPATEVARRPHKNGLMVSLALIAIAVLNLAATVFVPTLKGTLVPRGGK